MRSFRKAHATQGIALGLQRECGTRSGRAISRSQALQSAASPTVRSKACGRPRSISQTAKLTGEPGRDMGTNRGAIDAVVTAVRHDLRQCDGRSLPDPGFAPPPEPPTDRVPIALLGRNIASGGATAKPPEYAVDDGAVPFRPPATPTVPCLNRQQLFQDTPF